MMVRRRLLFPLAVVVITVLGVGAIITAYERSKAALVQAAEQDLRETAYTVSEDASHLFEPAPQIINRVLDARLPEVSSRELEQTLFTVASYPLYSLPQVDGIYVGTTEGSFFHLTDLIPNEFNAGTPDYHGAIRRVLKRDGDTTSDVWYFQDAATHTWLRSPVPPVPAGYDPRQRTWYTGAIERGGLSWSQPYIFASTQELGITLSAPIQTADGKLWGVVGIDYSLQSLAKVIADFDAHHVGSSGFMFIGNDAGELIGHSLLASIRDTMRKNPQLTIEQATSIHQLHLDNKDDLSIFNALGSATDVVRHITNGDRDILGIKLPLKVNGLQEYVYLGQPEDAVIGAAIRDLRRNVAILLGLLAIVSVIAFYAMRLRGEVAARKKSETALRESEAYTKILFQESDVPIVVMEPITRRFLDCNPAAAEIYGVPSRDDMLGKTPSDFSAPTQYDGADTAIATEQLSIAYPDAANMVFEWRHQRPNGEIWDASVHFTSFLHGGKKLYQFTVEDITERKRASEALQHAKDLAEEATKMKSSFLAMMSHEIRTPMNGVMAMAEMLDQTDLTDDQRSMSSVIRSSAGALLTIINDILDFSKIEAGKLDIESVPFSLVEMVESAGELVAGRTEERGIDLIIDLDAALPDLLLGDPARLRQILLNLMGNAAKFTEFGYVALKVFAIKSDGPALRLRFEVSDTGIGLTEEQRGRLFQPFVQADSSTSRKYGGTGLGLSICHRLCVMMDGSIGVESVAGEGSTFWFEVPLAISDPAPMAPAVTIADARISVIGFAGLERESLMRLIAATGATDVVCRALSELADVGLAATLNERVILLRAGPDETSVLNISRRLGGDHRVIIASPRGLGSVLGAATDNGAFATLTVPIRRQRLWNVIAAALGRADLNLRQAAAGTEALGWQPPQVEEARAANALILVAEDNSTNQLVIRRMLDQRGYAHEMAENGLVALSLYERGGYGMLLTDFHMPEMDGFQLTAAIRERESGSHRHLPIVALTADALPGTETLAQEARMDGYLTKPIESKALTATLEKYLPQAAPLRRRPTSAAERAPASRKPAAPSINPEILDLERLRETFGAIDNDAMSFLTNFVGDIPRMIKIIGTRLEAADNAGARDAAHALKGASFSAGANRLGQIAADIQDRMDDNDPDTASFLFEALAPTHEELRLALDGFRSSGLR